ncbi:hypothetical protein JJJ17_11165 [Paracoccus caeni]|uniref:Uncharacterized protein n=1 Tax=Paracoccus caeni TaxID=657651 RepID=A0A934SCS2_9RHOB|nr:hypothetical protein [Paracoccus caeni]MBK4216486.1 hypothetical protein [Paracoccus caeni]
MSKWRDLNLTTCGTNARCDLPSGFYRVNYFHGKEMRLADYVDEQRYHSGKHRFHNQRLHGTGILCGLKLSVMQPEGTLLRVGRGAALDDCGREIVVGYDQCVDVAAWFRQQAYEMRDQDGSPCTPDETNRVKLCVVIRYAECGGAPEQVPPDPCGGGHDDCGCGCGGECGGADPCGHQAEFGRVTEEFELRLAFADAAKEMTSQNLFPTSEAIEQALATGLGVSGLLGALTPAIRAACPRPDSEWLLLGCFHVTVKADKPEEIVAIDDIDYGCATQVLLSAEVIQHLLAAVMAGTDPDIGGPQITGILFRRLDAERYQFILPLSARIDASTLDAEGDFGLRRLTSNGWQNPAGAALTASYSETVSGDANQDGPAIYLVIKAGDGFIEKDGKYQLFAIDNPDPVVDSLLRRLQPRTFSWRFTLTEENLGDDLTMHPLGV